MDVKQQYIFDSHLILTVLKIECYLGFMLYARQRIMEPQKKHPANPIDEMLKWKWVLLSIPGRWWQVVWDLWKRSLCRKKSRSKDSDLKAQRSSPG
jgi:hypothetical protein